jgi:hypothetical protein
MTRISTPANAEQTTFKTHNVMYPIVLSSSAKIYENNKT